MNVWQSATLLVWIAIALVFIKNPPQTPTSVAPNVTQQK
jgi:hypothetical protein